MSSTTPKQSNDCTTKSMQIDQLEVSNAACFEAMQMNTESKVSQINTALYMLLNQSPQSCALLARSVNCI
jgi:hypothetical protein